MLPSSSFHFSVGVAAVCYILPLGRVAVRLGEPMNLVNSRLGLLAGVLLCTSAVTSAQVSLLTNRYDNARTGANLSETQLNTFNVSVSNFGKLWSYTVDGSAFAQPLYVPGLSISGGTHNVLYVATMNDKLYAFDADSNALLWCDSFTSDTSGGCNNPGGFAPPAGTTPIPMSDILPSETIGGENIVGNIGILSTPVIDPVGNTMYLVVRTKESGNPCATNFLGNGSYCQRLHAVDITTGAEKLGGPTTIAGSVSGTGAGNVSGNITFDPAMGNQRPGLALVNGQIFIAWASHEDSTPNYHGWVMSYDAATLAQTGKFNVTPNLGQGEGGVWMWGRAPAVDSGGNVYYMTGNGSFNGTSDYGDSFIGFSSTGGLAFKDFFTPANQAALNGGDLDLGSSGPMMIPGTNLLVGAGKSSILYVMDTTNPGDFGLEMLSPPPPLQDLYINNNIGTNYVKSGPVYWNRSGGPGPWLYVWAENDVARAYHFNGATFDDGGTNPATPISSGTFTVPGGNAGADISLSANGSIPGSGILWASIPTENADGGIHPGVLYAYNADDLTKELWDSTMNAARDGVGNWAKTTPPTVANGRVYMTSFPVLLATATPAVPYPSPANAPLSVYGLFDFTLAAAPPSITVNPAGSAAYTVNTASVYPSGFPSNVTYNVTGLPPGATSSFSANTQAVPGTSILTIATASSTPAGTYTLMITGTGGIQTHSANVTLVVSYNICLLYDATKSKKSGSTFPIKIQICDANGNNLSSPAITVQAQSVTMVSTNAPAPLDDSGDANPDFDFRYDSTLPGYIYNLSLKGISTGTYNLNFTVTGDPVLHSARFQVK